ncbi:MAG: GNAT family N-acetyltransferase [Calditrichaeota bacterium]|nr:MAG: GNAT family N-acetyltransferase [Calditrichota bacterium]
MESLKIQIIRSREALRTFRGAWEAFAGKDFPELVNSFPWQWYALAGHHPHGDLHVVVFREEQRLRGILPLCRVRSTFSRMPVWKYCCPEPHIGQTTPLIPPEHILGCFQRWWERQEYFPTDFHLINFALSPDQCTALEPFWQHLEREGLAVRFIPKSIRFLEVSSREHFWNEVLNKHRRKEFRRIQKHLQSQFTVQVFSPEAHTLAADFQALWERFLRLYRRSWKHRSPRSLTRNPAEAKFFRSLIEDFAARRQTRAFFLTLDEQDAAAVWWIVHRGAVYGLQTAYDARWQAYSPGLYLLQRSLLSLLEQGYQRINYMGAQPYKAWLSNREAPYLGGYIFNRGWYPQLLHRFSPWARRHLKSITALDPGQFREPSEQKGEWI